MPMRNGTPQLIELNYVTGFAEDQSAYRSELAGSTIGVLVTGVAVLVKHFHVTSGATVLQLLSMASLPWTMLAANGPLQIDQSCFDYSR